MLLQAGSHPSESESLADHATSVLRWSQEKFQATILQRNLSFSPGWEGARAATASHSLGKWNPEQISLLRSRNFDLFQTKQAYVASNENNTMSSVSKERGIHTPAESVLREPQNSEE